jgi:hypothetical protein
MTPMTMFDTQPKPAGRTAAGVVLVVAAAAVLLAVLAPTARAEGFLTGFTTGSSTTDAGAHPDVFTTISVGRDSASNISEFPRTIRLDLPPGLMGNPNAVDECPQVAVREGQDDGSGTLLACPPGSQVGTARVRIDGWPDPWQGAIFNVAPGPGEPARLAVAITNVPVIPVTVESRTESDFGLTTLTMEINSALAMRDLELAVWGVPGSKTRGGIMDCANGSGECRPLVPETPPDPPEEWTAFMTNPTVCDAPKLTTLGMTFYTPPYPLRTATSEDPTPTNCDAVPFDPSFDLQPTSRRADDAAGLEVDLGLPQTTDPDVIGTSHLRHAVVTLPEGTTLNPSAADGLAACTDEQFGLGTRQPARCPDASKIGTVDFDVPLLPGVLEGSLYLGQPLSTDPQSTQMLRIFQVAEGFGLNVKIPGYAKADPNTGRITATFGDQDSDGTLDAGEGLPQVPFTTVRMKFRGGPRGILATPLDCGTKTTSATFTPWSGTAPVTVDSSFMVSADGNGAACPAAWPFQPTLAAGMLSPLAGQSSAFTFTLSRPDRNQYMRGLTVGLPRGLLAKVRGVPLCTDAEAAAGACPAGSRIGFADAAAGSGSPFYLEQKGDVYLTEGYKGAPYGLMVKVPVVAGPFTGPAQLSDIVVRQAVHVDPVTAQVRVVSDPLPLIHHGIPLRIRELHVTVDRPGFMVNPTNCAARQIRTTVTSVDGAVAQPSQHFQARGCAALPFRPRMAMRLTGRRQTGDRGHPGLRTVVTQRPGQANIKKAQVRLPLTLALDPERAQSDDLCEYEAGLRVQCPRSSIIGNARAVSPLLNRPLTGPVYFVKNVRIHPRTGNPIRTLPTLLVTLRGEIAIDLRARTDTQRGKLVTTFPLVPDAAISRFELNLRGGRKGILIVNRSVCGRQVTESDLDGQNGKRYDRDIRMKSPCAKKRKAAPRVGKVSWRGNRITVRGRVNPAATKRVKVSVSCGKGRAAGKALSRRVRVDNRGRWRTGFRLRGRCANAERAKVSAVYPGGPIVKRGSHARTVRKHA